jgi:tetraacyldisaccharide 4'-kinase
MNPLSVLYGAVSGARNALYEHRLFRAHRLKGPVVSVGNLSVGGSGKTPFVIMLGELLKAHGIRFDVLSRGYGRQTTGIMQVNPSGTAVDFGDEPLLIARRLEVPVILGESRFAAGQFAEKQWGPQLHLLDDGFQHRALHRDFDIVLVSSDDAQDKLLPTGRLREPWSALDRADGLVLTNETAGDLPLPKRKIIWRVERNLTVPNAPPRPIAFCGIARPQRFIDQLCAAGVEPAVKLFFDDHHAYTEEDAQKLLQLKQKHTAGGFITTEKDEINLGNLASPLGTIAVARVTMELEDSSQALDALLQRITQQSRQP